MNRSAFFAALLLCAGTLYAETHIVAKGDTLYSISRTYGISVQDLCSQNGISQGQTLRVGQQLLVNSRLALSSPEFHVVAKNETLYGIAKQFGTDVATIRKMNGFGESHTIRVGERLKVPSSANAAIAADKAASTALPDLPSSDPRQYESSKTGDPSLVWPVRNSAVTYVNGKVSGVIQGAAKGATVSAIKAGTVMYCGTYRGYGQVVFVQSSTGHIYAYTGFGSTAVKKGDYVMFGDTMGTVGIDSISASPRIMLMVFQGGHPIDPASAPRG